MDCSVTVLQDEPFPVLLSQDADITKGRSDALILSGLEHANVATRFPGLGVKILAAQCRGVPLEKLPLVLRYGVDSEFPAGPFNVGGLYKAVEYTSNPGAVLFYNDDKLDATYREVPVNTDAVELATLGAIFPTKLVSADGNWLWFSRFPADHRQIQTPYEFHYARWIPGNPFEALIAVWILGEQKADLAERCRRILRDANLARVAR